MAAVMTAINLLEHSDATSGFDEDSWSELVMTTDGDAALISEIVDDFLSSADRQMRDLAGSIAQRDPDLTRRLAHTIKGGAATVGAAGVAAAAAEIEHVARAGSTSGLEPKLRVLDSSLSAARRTLNARVSALT